MTFLKEEYRLIALVVILDSEHYAYVADLIRRLVL